MASSRSAAPVAPLAIGPSNLFALPLQRGAGRPDFHIHTAALEVAGETPEGLLRVTAIGSSTIQDLQGDTMELSALQDMTQAPAGLLLFLNHSYNVPEDVAGHLYASPSIKVQNGIGDLYLDSLLYTNKPRIQDVAKDIANGGRHGVSIGCMVTAAEWRGADGSLVDPDSIDFWDIIEGRVLLHITHVQALEWSIVGIPANQRSWVQNAARGLLERGLSSASELPEGEQEGWAKQVKLLAPLVRAWWPNNYSSLVRSAGLPESRVKELLALPSRTHREQVTWTPKDQGWSLASGQRSQKRAVTITRSDVEALLRQNGAEGLMPAGYLAAATIGQTGASVQASETPSASEEFEGLDDDSLQDPWEETPETTPGEDLGDVEEKGMLVIKADGSHEAYTGTHTHAHKAFGAQGDDETHEHEHSHDGDAIHDHHAGGEKEATPELTAAETPAVVEGVEPSVDDNAPLAPLAPEPASDVPPAVEVVEPVAGVWNIPELLGETPPTTEAAPEVASPETPSLEEKAATPAVDPQRAALLKTYSEMLAPLGFVVLEASDLEGLEGLEGASEKGVTPAKQACSWSDQQESGIRAGIAAIDGQVDSLMRLAGIPDDDDNGQGNGGELASEEGEEAGEGSEEKSVLRLIQRSLNLGLALKAGKRHSQADMNNLQAIHDAAVALTDGAVCKSADADGDGDGNETSVTETPTNAGTGEEGATATTSVTASVQDVLSSFAASGMSWKEGLEGLTSSLGELAAAFAQQEMVTASIAAAEERAKGLESLLEGLAAKAAGYTEEVAQMRQRVERLSEMPLPRPTQMQRSVRPVDPALASYEDFFPRPTPPAEFQASAPVAESDLPDVAPLSRAEQATLLARALEETRLVTRASDGVECRLWPAGVGKGVRPALTQEQKLRMDVLSWRVYDACGEVLVPTFGESLELSA